MKRTFIKIKNILFKNYPRTFFTIYLLFGLFGGLILWLPFSHKEPLSFLDALFVSISAMSTTGLTPVNLTSTFTVFGKIAIMLIMQIGGMGIYMLIANFWVISGRKIGISERAMLAAEQNVVSVKGIIRNVKHVFLVMISIQSLAAIFMSIYFYFSEAVGSLSVWESILEAMFLVTALFMNAGFDIFKGGVIFANFLDYNHFIIIYISMFLIFIGGVGFIPISETIDWIKAKRKKEEFKFSYVSKLLFFTHLGLWFIGGIIFYFMEFNGMLDKYSFFKGITASFFTSISARSAGFDIFRYGIATVGPGEAALVIRPGTQIFLTLLMFIGASPNSTGGGIRITTAILVVAGIIRFSLNRAQTKIGKRAYKESTVFKAMVALIAALTLILFSVFAITIAEGVPPFYATFEVISAFGTVGYSNGLTAMAGIFSKIVLIIVMFIGRISIVTMLSVFDFKKREQEYYLTEFDLMVS
ncbi:MAG: TrkH family potassium uptake protein [Acholeplasmataceae bacterium]|jgi:Trk-type K+ transport system membrane component